MMTIKSNYSNKTLEEYLNGVRQKVESGDNPPSGIYLELVHFARLYRHAPPAEPGGNSNLQQQIPSYIATQGLIQALDEVRADIARMSADSSEGRSLRNIALTKLETISARFHKV